MPKRLLVSHGQCDSMRPPGFRKNETGMSQPLGCSILPRISSVSSLYVTSCTSPDVTIGSAWLNTSAPPHEITSS